ncbi:MAG: hypothetical protein WAO00_15070 [Chthoniobacterales bacterium]
MESSEIEALVKQIDGLVTDAQVAAKPEERAEHLQKALAKACDYLKGLNRRIPQVIAEIMAEGGFEAGAQSLPLRDIVRQDPQLEMFREKKYLLAFLDSSRDLLEEQMHFSPAKIEAFIGEVGRTYDDFMEQKIAINPLAEQFKKLQRYFCRPPWGGPGGCAVGPEPDNDGPSGVTKSRGETVCRWLTTATSVGTFLLPIIEKIIHSMSAKAPSVPVSMETYPHRVLALVLTGALADELEKRNELRPARAGVLVGAGN